MSTQPPILEEAQRELKKVENKLEDVKAQLEKLHASNCVIIEKAKIAWSVAKGMRRLSYVPLGAALPQLLLANLGSMFWFLCTWALMRGTYRYLDELTDSWYTTANENLDKADELMKGW